MHLAGNCLKLYLLDSTCSTAMHRKFNKLIPSFVFLPRIGRRNEGSCTFAFCCQPWPGCGVRRRKGIRKWFVSRWPSLAVSTPVRPASFCGPEAAFFNGSRGLQADLWNVGSGGRGSGGGGGRCGCHLFRCIHFRRKLLLDAIFNFPNASDTITSSSSILGNKLFPSAFQPPPNASGSKHSPRVCFLRVRTFFRREDLVVSIYIDCFDFFLVVMLFPVLFKRFEFFLRNFAGSPNSPSSSPPTSLSAIITAPARDRSSLKMDENSNPANLDSSRHNDSVSPVSMDSNHHDDPERSAKSKFFGFLCYIKVHIFFFSGNSTLKRTYCRYLSRCKNLSRIGLQKAATSINSAPWVFSEQVVKLDWNDMLCSFQKKLQKKEIFSISL